MKKYSFLLVALMFLVACSDPAPNVDKEIPEAKDVRGSSGIPNSTLIHNPVTADRPVDEADAAKFEFQEEAFDFGSIAEGEVVEHIFKFKNVGKAPLVITNAKGSCGCTVPEWPREPIAPNEEGEIKIKFNSKGKSGHQEKTVTLTANTYPNQTTLRIEGDVQK